MKDYGTYHTSVSIVNHKLVKNSVRVIRLEVRVGMKDYTRGQIIRIKEPDLQTAITESCADPHFKRRVKTLSLTFIDVNNIFKTATGGLVNLELDS